MAEGNSAVCNNLEATFENWVVKPLDDAIIAALVGSVAGFSMDLLCKAACSVFSLQLPDPEVLSGFGGYQPLMQSLMLGSRMHARNLAVTCGVGSGISRAMKNLRSKDDVQTWCMVASFGSGVMLSLVTGLKGPEAISAGVMHALVKGGLFKVKAKDVLHDKTSDAFSSIGLGIDHHAMNFNTGFFTGNALSLLPDHRNEAKKGGKRAWFC